MSSQLIADGLPQILSLEPRVIEQRTVPVGALQALDVVEVQVLKLGSAEVGFLEVGILEGSPPEIDVCEEGPLELGISEEGALDPRPI